MLARLFSTLVKVAVASLIVGTVLAHDDPLVFSVLESKTVLITDLSSVPGGDVPRARGVSSAISVPVIVRNAVEAVVSFVSHRSGAFDLGDLRLVESVVRESAGALPGPQTRVVQKRRRAVANDD